MLDKELIRVNKRDFIGEHEPIDAKRMNIKRFSADLSFSAIQGFH